MDECMVDSVVMYSEIWVDCRIKLNWRLVSGLARNKEGKSQNCLADLGNSMKKAQIEVEKSQFQTLLRKR